MSENRPLVTVLIPCYNALPYLHEALESIIHQTYSNLEILCINDGSSDKTAEVLDEYAKLDKRIKVIHNETNIKLIATLNKGVQLAEGKYIARMDSDDISLPNRIETQLNYLENNKSIDIVSTGALAISEDNKILTEKSVRNTLPESSLFVSFLFRPIGHPELLGKSVVFKENLFKKEEYTIHTEDYELWTRLLRKGYKLANLKELLYKFRINSQSVSRKFTKIQEENFVTSANIHYNAYFNDNLGVKITRVVVNRLLPSTNLKDWRAGVKTIKQLKNHFFNLSESREVKKEIKTVYQSHIFDVSVQSIKRCPFSIKLFAIVELTRSSNMFLNPSIRKYIKHKIYSKK